MIHVGMDTVNLEGKGFTPKLQQGAEVKKGDLLLEFDIEAITKAGYKVDTPVIVSNSDDYSEVTILPPGEKEPDEDLIILQ